MHYLMQVRQEHKKTFAVIEELYGASVSDPTKYHHLNGERHYREPSFHGILIQL